MAKGKISGPEIKTFAAEIFPFAAEIFPATDVGYNKVPFLPFYDGMGAVVAARISPYPL
ncbi:MAG: hypothetical protein ACI353_02725 [Alloprevotella sp.]